jgi:hypothetical protein
MRRIFSIKDPSSIVRTAIKAGDHNDPLWKLIMSGEPAKRNLFLDSSQENDDDVFEFTFVYSPPKSLKMHLPQLLNTYENVKIISVNHPSDEMNVVEVKVKSRGNKEETFYAILKVLVEDLELNIEDAIG